jgi:hypothetical protein
MITYLVQTAKAEQALTLAKLVHPDATAVLRDGATAIRVPVKLDHAVAIELCERIDAPGYISN